MLGETLYLGQLTGIRLGGVCVLQTGCKTDNHVSSRNLKSKIPSSHSCNECKFLQSY